MTATAEDAIMLGSRVTTGEPGAVWSAPASAALWLFLSSFRSRGGRGRKRKQTIQSAAEAGALQTAPGSPRLPLFRFFLFPFALGLLCLVASACVRAGAD